MRLLRDLVLQRLDADDVSPLLSPLFSEIDRSATEHQRQDEENATEDEKQADQGGLSVQCHSENRYHGFGKECRQRNDSEHDQGNDGSDTVAVRDVCRGGALKPPHGRRRLPILIGRFFKLVFRFRELLEDSIQATLICRLGPFSFGYELGESCFLFTPRGRNDSAPLFACRGSIIRVVLANTGSQ